ncbi:Fxr2 [Symbiodinium necroappetens]|uniref:Fxr2 protein n=1 Tax=Symbiodinium necroappetens TaxID=1628268 RepID=A0A812YK73_9DINO|nr:Fxr2 [Symbiodinium necroappetens]
MAFHGTPVEVRKNQKSTTWYSGELIDINGEDRIKVRFEEDIWPIREVPASSVRRLPDDTGSEDFNPQVDEAVEVLLSATDSNPSGWALGKVKTIKNSFYFITFDPTQKGKQDLIVERKALRRTSPEQQLDVSSMIRKLLPVDPDLHGWIRSQDSSGCLNHVQNKCNLLVANCAEPRATFPESNVLSKCTLWRSRKLDYY